VVEVVDPPPQQLVVLVEVVLVAILRELVSTTQGLAVLEVHHLQTNQEQVVEMVLL
tara:strand:- start:29 stop:196 length:168 start_codon:yes stop_codon:yes gene_type:complete